MTTTLENRLDKWIIKTKEMKFRPFSHVAVAPKEVEQWIPVNFDELNPNSSFAFFTTRLESNGLLAN